MNKLIRIFVFTMFLPATVFCQVEIDFADSNIDPVIGDVGKGEFFRVKVKNVNLNKYSIEVLIDNNVVPNAEVFPTVPSVDLSGLSSLASVVEDFPEIGYQLPDESNDQPIEGNTIIEMQKSDQNDVPKYFWSLMKKLWNNLEIQESELDSLGKDVSKDYQTLISHYSIFQNYRSQLLGYGENDLITSKITKVEVERMVDDLNKIYERNSKIKGQVKSIERCITEIYQPVRQNTEYPISPKLHQEILDVTQKVEYLKVMVDEIIAKSSKAQIDALLESILYLNEKTDYISLPIQNISGQTKVTVNIKPREEYAKVGGQSYTFGPFLVPGQLQNYISTGASFYAAGLRDNRVQKDIIMSDTSMYQLSDLPDNPFELGISSLLKYGRKHEVELLGEMQDVGLHFSCGLGARIGATIKPRILVGGGVTFGDIHNISIDYGYIIGYTSQLSPNIEFDREYLNVNDPFINGLRASFFISIGYSFLSYIP
ncbi:MAG: hypothetical protein JXQ87_14480 [Bacteroidia bacterium]